MKEIYTKRAMNIRGINDKPLISATHRGAYAIIKNTDKYKQVTALNTATYGKK